MKIKEKRVLRFTTWKARVAHCKHCSFLTAIYLVPFFFKKNLPSLVPTITPERELDYSMFKSDSAS